MHKVEQCDREAASAIFGGTPWSDGQFLSGKRDHIPKVQAFAAHRLAERERCAVIAENYPSNDGGDIAIIRGIAHGIRNQAQVQP